MKSILSVGVIILLLLGGLGVHVFSKENSTYNIDTLAMSLSKPQVETTENGFVKVNLKESSSFLSEPGKPLLPIIRKEFTYPLGTTILEVNVHCQTTSLPLQKPIVPCSRPMIHAPYEGVPSPQMDETVYTSDSLYPKQPFYIQQGGGIQNSEHVLFLTVHVIPQYCPLEHCMYLPEHIDIEIISLPPKQPLVQNDNYDMVIIAPEVFTAPLQPLLEHKNAVGIKTYLKTTEEIYNEYTGRDKPEQIKYFIKDAIETYGIHYVLLIGDVDRVPMRKSDVTVITQQLIWKGILTDLYYADIFTSDGGFSSWDSNGDNTFGECLFDFRPRKGTVNVIDEIDLYPDLGVGRIPCTSTEEVQIVGDKIITYETNTMGTDWFNRIILMGGDTTPGDDEACCEGEWFLETYIAPTMQAQGFNLVKLYTSQETFNPSIINQEVTSGAGFVCYAGHGNTNLIATYPPNETTSITYNIDDIQGMNNTDKLPIFFLDACLTGKLDYNMFDWGFLILFPFCLIKILLENLLNPEIYPCFAWSLVKKQSGGGIAVLASSQPSWQGYVQDGENLELLFGSLLLTRSFFEAYDEGAVLSDMVTQAQNSYITMIINKDGFMWDRNTLDEYNLIGDPSLKIGGYP
jgi:hypothetical protein